MDLPKDPIMLMSVLNTKLRDQYQDLDRLCEDMNLEKEVIVEQLKNVGFEYNPDLNQFR